MFFSEQEFQVVKAEQPIFCLPIDNNVNENQSLKKGQGKRNSIASADAYTSKTPPQLNKNFAQVSDVSAK